MNGNKGEFEHGNGVLKPLKPMLILSFRIKWNIMDEELFLV